MNVACLVVAGVVRALLPEGDVTLAWTHSVQKTRWEERYRVEGGRLRLVEAYVEGSGAGMEPPPHASRDGAGWRWSPDRTVPALVLASSGFGGDYAVCGAQGCRALQDLAGGTSPVELRACRLPSR